MFRPTRLIALISLSAVAPLGAQEESVPEAPRRDPGTYAHLVSFEAVLDSVVPALLDEHAVPGLVVAAVEGGAVSFTAGYGLANVTRGERMTDTTRINLASISKPVTTWAVLRLVEEGRFTLDTPIVDLITGWPSVESPYDASQVTVARILRHTGGLSMPSAPLVPADSVLPDVRAVVKGAVEGTRPVKLDAPPGGPWTYSGGGFLLLQVALEETTGDSFATVVRDRVFEPLGMRASTFDPIRGDEAGVAGPHDEDTAEIAPYVVAGAAAGGLYTTARDFARLLEAYVREGSPILRPAQFREIREAPVTVVLEGQDLEGAAYGLGHGVHRTREGDVILYHSGGNPGYRAYFVVAPESGRGLLLAANGDGGVPVIAEVLRLWSDAYGVDLPVLY